MVADPQTLAMYAALAEIVYRRDTVNDQALDFDNDIKPLVPTAVEFKIIDAEILPVTDQRGDLLSGLRVDSKYYYSDRGFGGMLVELDGKIIVVFRGTDSSISGCHQFVTVYPLLDNPAASR